MLQSLAPADPARVIPVFREVPPQQWQRLRDDNLYLESLLSRERCANLELSKRVLELQQCIEELRKKTAQKFYSFSGQLSEQVCRLEGELALSKSLQSLPAAPRVNVDKLDSLLLGRLTRLLEQLFGKLESQSDVRVQAKLCWRLVKLLAKEHQGLQSFVRKHRLQDTEQLKLQFQRMRQNQSILKQTVVVYGQYAKQMERSRQKVQLACSLLQ